MWFFIAGTKVDVVSSFAAYHIYSVLYVLQLQAGQEDVASSVWQ